MRTSKQERDCVLRGYQEARARSQQSEPEDLTIRALKDAELGAEALALLRSMRENHEHIADRADEVDALLEREGGE